MPSESQSSRQLAAILFADIVGYTSLMQQDEKLALQKIKRYQEILDIAAKEYSGQVLKNYGDGSLMTFSNSVDALKAAKNIQEQAKNKPTVPLRIGIHIGEFVVEKGDIYGNGVNLASRIESLGIEGAVLFSKNIYQKIKNLPEFEIQDLGSFDFKNVEEPMMVYALANKGFPVPQRAEMQGKLKTSPTDSSGSFFQKIWLNKIPQILIAYVVLAWMSLQVFDWALLQFGISPHWAKIFFITVIGIIPSLIVYLNNRDRIHQSQLKLGEKILFPSNFALVGLVLFFMFKSAELGAISKNITFINSDGIEETRNVVKEEFRKYLPIFRFDQLDQDSLQAWYSPGIAVALALDLGQDKYLAAHDRENRDLTTHEKIEEAKVRDGDYYIDGTYRFVEGQLEITPNIRNSKNGKLIAEQVFRGEDFFNLIDSASVYVRSKVGLSSDQIEESIDLKLREATTDNLEAFRFMTLSKIDRRYLNLEKALELDSTFAGASLDLALHGLLGSRGTIENKIIIDRAMRHRKKLPFQMQIATLTLNHLINDEWDKAEKLLKMQLEVSPHDPNFNAFLLGTYLMSGQIEKIIEHSERRFAEEPNFENGMAAINAAFMKGEPKTVIRRIKPFLLLNPQNTYLLSVLANAYIHSASYGLAIETIEKIILIEPDAEKTMSYLLQAVDYLKTHPDPLKTATHFEGTYRNSHGGQMSYSQIVSNQYFGRAKNQFGDFMFPAGDDILISARTNFAYRKKLLINELGEIYGTKNTNIRRASENNFYTWKQDSIIWKAEEYLRNNKYTLATDAYNDAIEKHPEHYYLLQAREHITFAITKSQEDLQKLYQKHVGKYGEIKIWIENGQLILKQEGRARRILHPISDHAFISLDKYSLIFDFEKKNGIVDAYQEYLYNHEEKIWEKDERWYRKKDVFLD